MSVPWALAIALSSMAFGVLSALAIEMSVRQRRKQRAATPYQPHRYWATCPDCSFVCLSYGTDTTRAMMIKHSHRHNRTAEKSRVCA